MSEPIIRLAQPGDEKAIHEAHMRSIREICIKDHGASEVSIWGNRPLGNRWIDPIKTGLVWVVELNNQIQGHGYIRIFEEHNQKLAHIHGLYLTPEVLGKGLGYKLVKLLIDSAKGAGVKMITLESTITAHPFYIRLGFTDVGPMTQIELGGQSIRCFPMKLALY